VSWKFGFKNKNTFEILNLSMKKENPKTRKPEIAWSGAPRAKARNTLSNKLLSLKLMFMSTLYVFSFISLAAASSILVEFEAAHYKCESRLTQGSTKFNKSYFRVRMNLTVLSQLLMLWKKGNKKCRSMCACSLFE
jgi:hypothetical protein